MARHNFRTMVGVVALALAGCNQLEILGAPPSSGIPDEVQRVFNERCNQAGCHGGGVVQQGLDLTEGSSAAILGRQAQQAPQFPLVELGNVAGSYLALKLLPGPPEGVTGARMPPEFDGTDPTLAIDVAIVIGWIAGAELPSGGGTGDSDSGRATAEN